MWVSAAVRTTTLNQLFARGSEVDAQAITSSAMGMLQCVFRHDGGEGPWLDPSSAEHDLLDTLLGSVHLIDDLVRLVAWQLWHPHHRRTCVVCHCESPPGVLTFLAAQHSSTSPLGAATLRLVQFSCIVAHTPTPHVALGRCSQRRHLVAFDAVVVAWSFFDELTSRTPTPCVRCAWSRLRTKGGCCQRRLQCRHHQPGHTADPATSAARSLSLARCFGACGRPARQT